MYLLFAFEKNKFFSYKSVYLNKSFNVLNNQKDLIILKIEKFMNILEDKNIPIK
jgi:hypothetical protein